ncbi:hypothetical protein VTK56DRAFT_4671 [Thermocarpiscus australiensis]
MPHIHVEVHEPGLHRRHHHHHDANTHRHRRQQERHLVEAPDFRFCVELGLVISSRHRKHKTEAGLQKEISTHLSQAGILNHIASSDVSPVSSREWTIASELCIPSRPCDHRFGMKLVSPFMRFTQHPEHWQADLRKVMHTLNRHFEVTTSHQCFTHVHIVPATGFWQLGQAKALAKSALYFEACLDALVPPYRRRSVWAKSNRHNRYFGALPMAKCFARIDAQSTLEALATRMNLCGAASPTGAALGVEPVDAEFRHDAFRWSFADLGNNNDEAAAAAAAGFGTVAFRQPPGSTTAAEAITWVMLVGCLARLSCGLGHSLEPAHAARLVSLGEWLLYEAEWCGMPRKGLLTELLLQAVPVTPAPGEIPGMDASAITADEGRRLRWKAEDRNIPLEKYRRLLKHL